MAFLRGWTAENIRIVLYEVMERYVLSRAQHVVCVSRKQAEQVGRMRSGRSKPIVVPNAMLPPWSRPDHNRAISRTSLNIPADAFVFGSVGRLSAEKGHRFMISAFLQANVMLRTERPIHLLVVGDGREQESLERQASEFHLSDKIHFAGFQGNPAAWLNLFDCMIQPSLTEGTPNSVLEAICLNVPVIATAVGGVPDLIANEENGLLVPPKDAPAIAAAMKRMVLDSALRRRLANAAQETSRNYSPATQKQKLIAVYETALAS